MHVYLTYLTGQLFRLSLFPLSSTLNNYFWITFILNEPLFYFHILFNLCRNITSHSIVLCNMIMVAGQCMKAWLPCYSPPFAAVQADMT